MKHILCIAGSLIFSVAVNAATIETVVKTLAIPANASYSANDWSAVNAIPGVKWAHKGLKETPVSPFTKLGSIKLDKLPIATLFFTGARTMVFDASVVIGGNDQDVIEKNDFTKVLRGQFSPTTKIRQLRGGCKSENGIAGTAVYEIVVENKKPVYVQVEVDAGGNSPNSRTTGFQFVLEPEKSWACK
jgi:hypothetical protein